MIAKVMGKRVLVGDLIPAEQEKDDIDLTSSIRRSLSESDRTRI